MYKLKWFIKKLLCKITSYLRKTRHLENENGWCSICLHYFPEPEFKGKTWLDWFCWTRKIGQRFPYGDDQGRAEVSNGQLRRWLDQGAVTINGKKPKALDKVEFPITEIVFFKGSKRQTTFLLRQVDKGGINVS